MDSWLVDPTGKENLWLLMIAPCAHILRGLVKQVHATFGSHQGSKHTSPDLQRDIGRLLRSLDQQGVYIVDEGRCIDSEDGEVTNVVAGGIKYLQEPLREHNELFCKLQSSIRLKPLVGERYIPDPVGLHAGTSSGDATADMANVGDPQDSCMQAAARDADVQIDDEALEDEDSDGHGEDAAEA